MNAPAQILMWLPPPITAHEAAAILGRLGGQERARKARAPILAKASAIRRELGLDPDQRLAG